MGTSNLYRNVQKLSIKPKERHDERLWGESTEDESGKGKFYMGLA